MAFIGLKCPHEVGRLLHGIEVPGEKVPVDEYHVTLLYLGKDVPIETLGKAIVAAAEVAAAQKPFRCTLTHVTSFPKNDDGVPIICPVASPDLHELNDKLKKKFDGAGVSYSKKFPEYKPHLTLAYADSTPTEEEFGPLEWSAYEMVLWGGDAGDERLATNFPFSMPVKVATNQNLVRLAMRLPQRIRDLVRHH